MIDREDLGRLIAPVARQNMETAREHVNELAESELRHLFTAILATQMAITGETACDCIQTTRTAYRKLVAPRKVHVPR